MGVLFRIGIILVMVCMDMVLSGYFGGSLISLNATLMLVLAWSLILGFTESIGWVILAGAIADLLLFRPLGLSIIIFTVVSYGSSFLSKRFLTSHPFWILIPFFGTVLFSVGVEIVAIFLFWGVREGSSLVISWISHTNPFMQVMFISVNALFFFISYKGLNFVETFLSYYKRRIQPKRYV